MPGPQVYRLLNADMYVHIKCFTCNGSLKGSSRHCPEPSAIKQHFSKCGDVDMCITEKDAICTNCYNVHLAILRDSKNVSYDEELKALLEDPIASAYLQELRGGILTT